MAHDSPASGFATVESSVLFGAIDGDACLRCSSDSAVAGPKAAAAAAVIDSSVDQKVRLDIRFCRGFAGKTRSVGLGLSGRGCSGVGALSLSALPAAASVGGGSPCSNFGATGRRRWNTSLASGPAAGTRSSTSRWRMRSDLTCETPKQET